MKIAFPLRVDGGMNVRDGHWGARARRVRNEREWVRWILMQCAKPKTPCIFTLTRTAPSRGLDDDNLASALKSVRDEIADWMKVDDKLRDVVRYEYANSKGDYGVTIESRPMQ